MDDMAIRILLVEDDEDDYVLTRDTLREIYGERCQLDWETDYDRAMAAIRGDRHDVYLVRLPTRKP